VKIKDIIEEYGISVGAYYHWSNRYARAGILGFFVVLTILRAFRLHSKPELFHHDNGGEYDNGVVSRLLQMLGIVDVPTEVENPKGNGKKERAHSQDRK
jgi:transposase